MSRTSRILAGALLAAVAAVALAAPANALGTTVSFSGSSPLGLPLLACASSPNRSSVSITTDDTLNVENLTGHPAYVYLNGSKTSHQVGPNQGVPITFPAGSWTVAMAPSCLVNLSDAGTVSVTVTSPAKVVAPTPTPTHTSAPVPTHTTKPIPPAHTQTPAPRSAPSASPSATSKPAVTPSLSPLSDSSAPGSGSGGISAIGSGGGSHPSAGVASGGTTATPGAKGSSTVASGGSGQVQIGTAQAVPAGDLEPAAPNYLLAVVALIGILGVGSATVRALNGQRKVRRLA